MISLQQKIEPRIATNIYFKYETLLKITDLPADRTKTLASKFLRQRILLHIALKIRLTLDEKIIEDFASDSLFLIQSSLQICYKSHYYFIKIEHHCFRFTLSIYSVLNVKFHFRQEISLHIADKVRFNSRFLLYIALTIRFKS